MTKPVDERRQDQNGRLIDERDRLRKAMERIADVAVVWATKEGVASTIFKMASAALAPAEENERRQEQNGRLIDERDRLHEVLTRITPALRAFLDGLPKGLDPNGCWMWRRQCSVAAECIGISAADCAEVLAALCNETSTAWLRDVEVQRDQARAARSASPTSASPDERCKTCMLDGCEDCGGEEPGCRYYQPVPRNVVREAP